MIIVTGANGHFGRLVVEHLLKSLPASRIGASVRDPEKASDLSARGVRVRRGDFDSPDTLAHAFEGAERLLLVSTDAPGEARVRGHLAAVEAARRAGVRHLLYTSIVDVAPDSPSLIAPDHAATEAAVHASGITFTLLRNNVYAEAAGLLLGDAPRTGVVVAPEDGPFAYASRADFAEAAARILADGTHEGETLSLTGAEALDLSGVVGMASEVFGRPIELRTLPDEAYRDGLVAHGVPRPVADLYLSLFVASRQGRYAGVDPALGQILGHPPISLRQVLASAPR
jgi:uncharacterized protein YbjT (DUF2867 family)